MGKNQIRHSLSSFLTIRPYDDDNIKICFITGTAPKYIIVGWIYAKDGKQKKYYYDGGSGKPYYRVPQDILTPFSNKEK